MRVEADQVDAAQFRSLVRDGEVALRCGDVEAARQALTGATSLWRGEPFGDVAMQTGLAREATRLREEYHSALEVRVDADLAAGCHRQLVPELETLTTEHPFRERFWGQLMVALYRSGRQADALSAYQRVRKLLAIELGLEPGGELRRLEQAVLTQDIGLDPVAPASQVASIAGNIAGTPTVLRSPVRYAVCDDGVHVAYQVAGNGPVDIVVVPGFVSHLDMWWDAPTDQLVRRLASFGRLIIFDKRGMGLSDRPEHIDPTQWVEDVRAVLAAVGSQQAVIFGVSAGAPTALLFAAAHPDETRAVMLWGGSARFTSAAGYDIGYTSDEVDAFASHLEANWGTGVGISQFAPSRAADSEARNYWARYQRMSASPSAAAEFLRATSRTDARDVLARLHTPTLILHAARDRLVPLAAARFLADHIGDARLVELDSDVHLIWLSDVVDDGTAEIESFLGRLIASGPADPVVVTILAVRPAPAWTRWHDDVGDIVKRGGGHVLDEPGLSTFSSPTHALRCARTLAIELEGRGRAARMGVHSGECVVDDKGAHGIAVSVTRELAAVAAPGEVLVTQTVRDLTESSGLDLTPHSRRAFDGIAVEWDVFAVRSHSARDTCASLSVVRRA